MPRSERAKQFAPFDALKGLQKALRMKEYEHERNLKGDLPDEKIEAISNLLLKLKKGEVVYAKYFDDGFYKEIQGKVLVDITKQLIVIENKKINFNDLFELEKTIKN